MNRSKISQAAVLALWVILVVLTVVGGWWQPLAVLFLLHLAEVFFTGWRTGKEYGVAPAKSVILTLIFGVTWWGPLRKKKEEL